MSSSSKNIFTFLILGLCIFSGALISEAAATSTKNAVQPKSTGTSQLKSEIRAQQIRLGQIQVAQQSTPGIARTLRRGSKGKDVRLLQEFLKSYGVFTDAETTEYFGTRTASALKEFQKREHITTTGTLGPITRARVIQISIAKLASSTSSQKSQVSPTATTTPEGALPTIENVLFSKNIGEDGSGIDSSLIFASTTQNIYAILTLANAKQDTAIGMMRYFKDTYVDSGVTHPSRAGLRYMHFQWTLKPNTNRTPGVYAFVFYVDGKKVRQETITIK